MLQVTGIIFIISDIILINFKLLLYWNFKWGTRCPFLVHHISQILYYSTSYSIEYSFCKKFNLHSPMRYIFISARAENKMATCKQWIGLVCVQLFCLDGIKL